MNNQKLQLISRWKAFINCCNNPGISSVGPSVSLVGQNPLSFHHWGWNFQNQFKFRHGSLKHFDEIEIEECFYWIDVFHVLVLARSIHGLAELKDLCVNSMDYWRNSIIERLGAQEWRILVHFDLLQCRLKQIHAEKLERCRPSTPRMYFNISDCKWNTSMLNENFSQRTKLFFMERYGDGLK